MFESEDNIDLLSRCGLINKFELKNELQKKLPSVVLENLTLIKRIDEIDYIVLDGSANIDYVIVLNDDEEYFQEINEFKAQSNQKEIIFNKSREIQNLYRVECNKGEINLKKETTKEINKQIKYDPTLPILFETIDILNSNDSNIMETLLNTKCKIKQHKKTKLDKKWKGKLIEGPPYKCEVCYIFTNDFNEIIKHFRGKQHNSNKISLRKPLNPPYNCDMCNFTFNDRKKYLDHNRNIHGPRNIKCPHCDRRFSCQSKMKPHLATHSKEKNYQCDKCAAQFNQSVNLKRHMWIHSDVKPFVCKFCGRGFTQSGSLKLHELLHTDERPYLCQICGISFRRSFNFNKHLLQHENNRTLNTPQVKKTTFPVKCHNCDVTLSSQKEMREHKSKFHKQVKTFECEICRRLLYSKINLEVHIKNHLGVKPFSCQECSKSFASSQLLKLHSAIHTGIRPYVCHVCNRSFVQKPHLKEHIIRHSGVKMFKCNYCVKRFFSKGALTCHERIHTGETPYECDFCHMKFKHINNMKSHKKKHNVKEIPFKSAFIEVNGIEIPFIFNSLKDVPVKSEFIQMDDSNDGIGIS